MMNSFSHDYSDVERLDQHFADKRATDLALAAEAARTEHAARMATLRNERIRRTGLAALPIGAGIGLALFGASFLITPKEHISYRDVPGPVVTRDVRIVKVPEYVTQKEKDFTERPEYKSAKLKGHLVADADGYIRFDDGQTFIPLKPNPTTGLLELDKGSMYDTTPYLGDLGYCDAIPGSESKTANHTPLFDCQTIHKDVIVSLNTTYKKKTASAATPQHTNADMIQVDVNADGYPIRAAVDTGCQWPMAITQAIADALVVNGHATRAGQTTAILADGSKRDVAVIMIKSITVDGRTIEGVEATVSPGDGAMILLGLGALNRLGKFSIDNGKIVFAAGPPA
jgi:predicted aspartyl protease